MTTLGITALARKIKLGEASTRRVVDLLFGATARDSAGRRQVTAEQAEQIKKHLEDRRRA
jgi:hypothetical protein